MKYLCLIYSDQKDWMSWPEEKMKSNLDEFVVFTDEIKASGHMLGMNRLQPTTAARTVRIRDGRISSTDGPFAETKEQLGGYYLLEAESLDEAAAIAARIPAARFGSVEVRPVVDFP